MPPYEDVIILFYDTLRKQVFLQIQSSVFNKISNGNYPLASLFYIRRAKDLFAEDKVIRYCIFLAKHTIFKNHKLEWYLLQTIWIDLRHAIEKRSKKFDTMNLKIFSPPYLISRLKNIYILAKEGKYIIMLPNIRIQGYARYATLLCLT